MSDLWRRYLLFGSIGSVAISLPLAPGLVFAFVGLAFLLVDSFSKKSEPRP